LEEATGGGKGAGGVDLEGVVELEDVVVQTQGGHGRQGKWEWGAVSWGDISLL